MRGFLRGHGIIAFGAGEVKNDSFGLVVKFLADGAKGMEKLVRDVRKNGSATGGPWRTIWA
jgi:hypothetical protein